MVVKKLIIISGLAVSIFACGAKPASSSIDAEKLYRLNCVICHGMDGKLGINGAKDLTKSPMTLDERIQNITYGKGVMTPFNNLLTEEEIKAVAKYTLTLK